MKKIQFNPRIKTVRHKRRKTLHKMSDGTILRAGHLYTGLATFCGIKAGTINFVENYEYGHWNYLTYAGPVCKVCFK